MEHSGRGRKLVGPRKASSRPRRKNPPTRRKNTKVGKKAMVKSRAPLVETKSKTTEDLIGQFGLNDHITFFTFNSETVHINPDVFHAWQQGLGEQQCIGQSIFVKYLKRKMTIRFPQPGFVNTFNQKKGIIPKIPMRWELIWGFIPAPLNYTGYTTPTAPNCNMAEINGYINKRVKDYFDERKDKLRFIPKRASTLRIVGRRKLQPDLRHMATASNTTQYDGTAEGTVPDVQTSIYWPMMRKVHLEQANDLHGGNPGLYPNYSWLPFCCIFQENWEEVIPDERAQHSVSVAYNDAIYYTDS